jgi:hypothetical protein
MRTQASKLGRVCVSGASSPLGQELVYALKRSEEPWLRPEAVGIIGSQLTSLDEPLASRADFLEVHGNSMEELEAAFSKYRPHILFSVNDDELRFGDRDIFAENKLVVDVLKGKWSGLRSQPKTRMVLVTLLGCGDSENAIPMQAMDSLRPLLLELSRVEQYVRESGIPYTIVRPGALENGDSQGRAVVSESRVGYGTIHRGTMARLLLNIAASERAVNKTLIALDMNRLLVAAPYVRPFEIWESPPFDIFNL